ncbi:MAG: ABC transporter permease [Verrucomicrobia bacterium GWC2_42_7]|nr:MAG: ABC transporter permease [Verrucomicrobia bacterium GWC2_42_7]
MKRLIIPGIFIFSCLTAWEILALEEIIPVIFLPAPSKIFSYICAISADGTLFNASWITCKRLFMGYLLSACFGIPLGILNAQFPILQRVFGWLVLGLQTLPSVCWVPLSLLWFGQTETSLLFVVIMGSLWSIIIATETGIRSVPPLYIRAAHTMGSNGIHTWIFVLIPASFPFIVSGLKQGWAFSWRSLMAAEIFVPILSGFGLGQLLHYGRELNAMDQVLAIIFVLILIGILSDKLLFSPFEKFIHHRWGTDRK